MGNNAPFQIDGANDITALREDLLSCLPAGIREILSESQCEALARTLGQRAWNRHPVNIRLSLPVFGNRYYFAMVAGKERRSPKRLIDERGRHPVSTTANVFFGIGLITLCGFAAIVAMILQSALAEF